MTDITVKDIRRVVTVTTGLGSYALGAAVAGFLDLTDLPDGTVIDYVCERGTQREVGQGTLSASGTVLSRTTCYASTNGNNFINWGSGTKQIALTVSANTLQKLADNVDALDDLPEHIRDTMGTALVAGTGLTKAVDDAGDTVTFSVTAMTADRTVITDGSGNLSVSTVTATELGYVGGATSSLQAQITALQALTIRQPKVIDRVDNTAAPPTTSTGDRYLLDDTGSSHAGWNGAAANSLVEYNGSTWDETVPAEGWVVYVDGTDTDWLAIDDGSLSWQERTSGAVSLNGLIDVVITTPSADDVLIYDGSTWRNQSQSTLSITVSQISDFAEGVDDRVNTLLTAGSGVTLTYDDGANTLTIDAGAAVGQLADLTDVDDSLAGNKGDLLYHDEDEWTDLDVGNPNDRLEVRDECPTWQAPGPAFVIKTHESGSNIDLTSSTDPAIVGGTSITHGDAVLLSAQTAGSENGLYTAVDATDPTTWVRHDGMAADGNASGRIFYVRLGTHTLQTFVCSSQPGFATVGTHSLSFTRIQ